MSCIPLFKGSNIILTSRKTGLLLGIQAILANTFPNATIHSRYISAKIIEK